MRKTVPLWALAAALASAACHNGDGTTSSDAAVADRICSHSAPCSITSAVPEQGYICLRSGSKCLPGDEDWYALDVATALPRQLLTVKAVFPQQTSPVVLAINVLKSDGTSSIASAVDQHIVGNPGAQLVARLPDAGRYYIVVSNDPSNDPDAVESRFSYTLTATVSSDPDSNEPNDTSQAATPIALPACGAAPVVQGALATTGDLDYYGFDVSLCSGARTILYVQVQDTVDAKVRTGANAPRVPLQFTLTPPSGVARETHSVWVSTATQAPAMAIVVTQSGHYSLLVQSYKATSTSTAIADPRFTYQVTVKTFADLDPSEGATGNDTLDTATSVSLTAGGPSVTKQGRLSFIDDVDNFVVTGTSSPARLHYKLTYSTDAGQFDPLPSISPKDLEVVENVGSGVTCKASCPGGSGNGYGSAWCNQTPALCLWQRRLEDSTNLPQFQNFEGEVYVPAGSKRYVQVKYLESPAADDKIYSLELSLLAGQPLLQSGAGAIPDSFAEAANLSGSVSTVLGWGFGERTGNPAANNIAVLPTNANPPDPVTHDPGQRIDYDAASQVDFYKVALSGTVDQNLNISWTVAPGTGQSAGSRSYDVGLRLHFCADAACSTLVSSGFFDTGTSYGPWFNTATSVPYFTFAKDSGTVTMNSTVCPCVDSAYTASQYFYVEVQAQDRTSYVDSQTTLNVSTSAYSCSGAGSTACGFVKAIKSNN